MPDVLRSISSYGSTPAWLPSLAAWLLRHGRHMQSFGLFCHKGNGDAGLFAWELSACLGALATASSLQQLRVHFNCAGTALRITSWCAALRQLQQIDLTASSSFLRISSSLHSLTQLTLLELAGTPVRFAAGARLPASVRRLQLMDSCSTELPPKVQCRCMPDAMAAPVCVPWRQRLGMPAPCMAGTASPCMAGVPTAPQLC